jgi:hypothetical protein
MSQSIVQPVEEKKLLKILSSFTREELKRFRDYVLSSYLKNKGPLIEFLDVLLPMLNDGKRPTGAQIVKLLVKTGRLSTATYRSLFIDLSRMAQSFIKSEGYNTRPEKAVNDLLTAVNAKRLNKLFDINLSLAKKIQSNISNRSADYYLREFVIETEIHFHRQLSEVKEIETPAQVMERMDVFYITNKLRYSCATQYYKQKFNKKEEPVLLGEIIELVNSGKYDDVTSVKVYTAILQMLSDDEDEEHFDILKRLLKADQSDLDDVILRDAYVFAINYCVRRINKGKFNYLRDVYELYQIALDKHFLYDENELSAWDYSNIMALGIQLRDYNWSEKLIEVYKERVPTAGKKMNVITFNMAKMYFFGGRYKDVLQLLEGVKSEDLMYVLGAGALLIKTYYETDDKEELNRHLMNFKTNLKRRKKIDEAERKSYLQFVDFTTRLSQIAKKDKKSLRELKSEISELPDTAELEWLLEKVK